MFSAQEWYGQCVSSRKFGKFPYRLVSVKSHRVSNAPNNGSNAVSSPSALAAMSSSNGYRFSSQQHISKPVPGSLIHTGHGDIDQDKCWGNVGHIDEIYLKNPVIRPSDAESRSHGVSFISSITALHDDILSTPGVSAKVRPISTNPIKLDFDPLKAWDLPTVPEVLVPKPAPVPSAKPPPVNAKPTISPDVFNSLKTEYEKWDKIKSTEKSKNSTKVFIELGSFRI
jgi:hypothetical protein